MMDDLEIVVLIIEQHNAVMCLHLGLCLNSQGLISRSALEPCPVDHRQIVHGDASAELLKYSAIIKGILL
jgi:hypothetical protein